MGRFKDLAIDLEIENFIPFLELESDDDYEIETDDETDDD